MAEQFSDAESSSSNFSSLFLSSVSMVDISTEEQCETKVTLENCSNSYIAGYLGKKCIEKFNFENCSRVMLKSDEDNTFNQQ